MPLDIAPDDDSLSSLSRANVPSSARADVVFRVDRVLGVGGMSVAFFALRAAPDGTAPVVLKVLRPSMVRAGASIASLVVKKEAVALGRLNERVPPTPFVVRLVESGVLTVRQGGALLELPWLALEYVHGGVEGTTLAERVNHSVHQTGFAFDPDRAAHAISCLANGLDAIHEMDVLHRDIKPANVLCCGFGENEIFKIADFGVARPKGGTATFGGIPVGTPGYAAPEQVMLDDKRIGPESDVFSLAALVFQLLTGEEYFPASTPVDGVVLVQDRKRRSITESRALCPELREQPTTCATIDAALARATSADPRDRPHSGAMLAASLLPVLRSESGRLRPTLRRLRSIARAPTVLSGYRWTVRHRPGEARIVRRVAWDSDGRCLAATDSGLAFWTGTDWEPAPTHDFPKPSGIRFVRRVGAGVWFVGGDDATMAQYSTAGVSNLVRGADPSISFTEAVGVLSDLTVLVGSRENASPVLYALAARHWLKPAALPKAAFIASIARLADEEWLVAGRSAAGDGFVAVYSPLLWEVKRRKTREVRAFLSTAAQTDLGVGVVVGTGGAAVRLNGDALEESVVPGQPDLSAVALDASGRTWAGSRGALYLQQPDSITRWVAAWSDPSWQAPFISIFADSGSVIAMTADGAILEGRDEKA
jgi:serine/threonine protein kinase